MPKGKRGKPPEEKPSASAEVVQFRPPVANGSEPQPMPAVDLSHMEPEEAKKVLTEVAALNDRAIDAFKAYEKARDEAKHRKAKWDELSEQVQSRLKELTHPSELPLFDERKAEEDLSRLQAQAADPPHTIPDSEVPF